MMQVDVDHLEPNPWNPNVMSSEDFEGLKADVIAGDYNDIVVSPKNIFYGDQDLPSAQFVIVDGEHRWRAAVDADVGYINIDVREMSEAEAKAYNYRRNVIRGSMDPVKEGELFNLDVEELGSEEAVADRYGRSRSYIAGRRSLVKLPESVKLLHREPEKGLEELKKIEIEAGILEDNPDEEYTPEQMEEMVEATVEANEFVPRGTFSTSHMEALAGLSEGDQTELATRIVERNLTVRDTETAVRNIKERVERRARFEEALERAVTPNCPECGAPPKDFERRGWSEYETRYDEDSFRCSQCYNDWPYMVKAPSRERRLEEQRGARSERLSEARANPGYIRRAETRAEINELLRPWILRKVLQFDHIERVSIRGRRGDDKVYIDWPSNYGSGLTFSANHKSFNFSLEAKTYKNLPFKTKIDISGEASPEARAGVQYFLDNVITTDYDPFLPENSERRAEILNKYDEEAPTSKYDKVIDAFIEGDHDLVKVEISGVKLQTARKALKKRITERSLDGNVKVDFVNDVVYLERLREAEG